MTDPLDSEETRIFRAPGSQGQSVDLLRQGAEAALQGAQGGAAAALEVPAVAVESGAREPRPRTRPVAPVETHSPLFRSEALRAYSLGQGLSAPLDVAPLATRVVFLLLLALAVAALLLAALGRVELTSRGRGVLRVPEGVRPVAAPISGVVSEVLVRAGDTVEPGQVLLRIDSTQIRAELLAAERTLAAVEQRVAEQSVSAERLHRVAVRELQKRRALTERRIKSQQRGMQRLTQRSARVRALSDEGLSDLGSVEEAGEALDGAERAWLTLQDQRALVDVELSQLERELETGRAARREELERARSARDAVGLMLEQTELKAARRGKVEGLHVTPGEQVQAGMLLARLVPPERPHEAVAFMPERDRAFLVEGREVRLELDRLPVGEFGSVAAKVTRISNDLASHAEVMEHLGTQVDGAWFRVDLTIDAAREGAPFTPYLQSGTQFTLRAPLRSRRILSLMFDPIRRVLD